MIVLPDDEIEPNCISDVDDERFRVQLWKMKELLESQVKKERFWETDEDFLLAMYISFTLSTLHGIFEPSRRLY